MGIYNGPQKRRGIGKTSDHGAINSGRQQNNRLIPDYWLQVGLGADLVMIGRLLGDDRVIIGLKMGENGGKNSKKKSPKRA